LGLDSRDAALVDRIRNLKVSKSASILAHNCQSAEIQQLADFVGDSWEMVCQGRNSKAEEILVCGVSYIAEMVAIFCPEKTVLLPEPEAICPLTEMITLDELKRRKSENPKASVVCYIKSPAEIKAESDVCCSSANAGEILRSLGSEREVIFVPDLYLGDQICQALGRDLTLWPGYCPSLSKILPKDVMRQKREFPRAKVLAHAQCTPQIKSLADAVGSTSELISFACQAGGEDFIVASEAGLLNRLEKECPGKRFILASPLAVCGKMKKITLEKVLWSLESGNTVVRIPEDVRVKALSALEKMSSICEGKAE
jgi:quinolinate synthase